MQDEFIGDSSQKVISRYKDFVEIGQWGAVEVDSNGNFIRTMKDVGGKMLSESVKFVDSDGKTKLGKDWIADNMSNEVFTVEGQKLKKNWFRNWYVVKIEEKYNFYEAYYYDNIPKRNWGVFGPYFENQAKKIAFDGLYRTYKKIFK